MDESSFFASVCLGMGWQPTQERILMFEHWHQKEGMPLQITWNPIATCWLSDDTPVNLAYQIPGLPPGNWNVLNPARDPNYGVRVYATPEAGIRAVVHTLQQGYYPTVRHIFETLEIIPGVEEEMLMDEFTTYIGSRAYGAALTQEWEVILNMPDPRVDAILATLEATGISAWQTNGNEPIIVTIGKIQSDIAQIRADISQIANNPSGGMLDQAKLESAYQTVMGINTLLNTSWRPILQMAINAVNPGVVVP